jgi:hypothetical protein
MPLPATNYEFGDSDFITEPGITQMQSAVFPLVVATKSELIGVGTAFCVAGAGVLATARHVVDAANEKIAKIGGGLIAVVCYGNPKGDEQSILEITVPITDICAHPDQRFDFALLTAAVPFINDEPIHFPSLQLDFDLPSVGDEIVMMGYTAFTIERPTQDTIRIEQPLSLSRGRVVDVYPVVRDSLKAPFPCFGTDGQCKSGMSGGPALRIGPGGGASVVGVNFSEYEPNPDAGDPLHSSFAAAIQTLLPMEVVGQTSDGERVTETLLALGRRDYLVSETDFSGWSLKSGEHGVAEAVYEPNSPR